MYQIEEEAGHHFRRAVFFFLSILFDLIWLRQEFLDYLVLQLPALMLQLWVCSRLPYLIRETFAGFLNGSDQLGPHGTP